jgi:hypothetical protein
MGGAHPWSTDVELGFGLVCRRCPGPLVGCRSLASGRAGHAPRTIPDKTTTVLRCIRLTLARTAGAVCHRRRDLLCTRRCPLGSSCCAPWKAPWLTTTHRLQGPAVHWGALGCNTSGGGLSRVLLCLRTLLLEPRPHGPSVIAHQWAGQLDSVGRQSACHQPPFTPTNDPAQSKSRLELVVFAYAAEHVARISRIIRRGAQCPHFRRAAHALGSIL